MKISSSSTPIKKTTATPSSLTTNPTTKSKISVSPSLKKGVVKSNPIPASDGGATSASTKKPGISKTSTVGTTKKTQPTSTKIPTKLVATATTLKSKTELLPKVSKVPRFELTLEWCQSLLLDINLDHTIPVTSCKHPNHLLIKSIDEATLKDMENNLPYSISDGGRRLSPCDHFGIQFDGQYTTGHNCNFILESEKFSFFSWTLILRVFMDEKSSNLFAFGPWYRWFVLSPTSVQLNQGNTFLAKLNGFQPNQWNDISVSFNLDQEKQPFDNCKIDHVLKGKKNISIIINGVENNFNLPLSTTLRGPEDDYGVKNEKCLGFMNMSNACTLRGTVSSIIILNRACESIAELKGISSALLKQHAKPTGIPTLIDQVSMPKTLPKECLTIKGYANFTSTVETHSMIVLFFYDSSTMYQKRQFVFPFINYFAEFFSNNSVNESIKFGKIDIYIDNYEVRNMLKFKGESFLFYKNGNEINRLQIECSSTLDDLKKELKAFEKLVGYDELPPRKVTTETTEIKEVKNEKQPELKKPEKKNYVTAIREKVEIDKPAEWLECISADINVNYDIRIANPNHPNHSLYSKHNVLNKIVEQCRSSVDKSIHKDMAICDDWGIQFDGDYEGCDTLVQMKAAYFTKSCWSLFLRVYVDSGSKCVFSFGPSSRWFGLTKDSIVLNNFDFHVIVQGIRYDNWNDIYISFNVDLPKSPKDICKVNRTIKDKKEILLIINDSKDIIPLDNFKFSDRLDPSEDNSVGFMNMGSGSCLRGVVSSLVILNRSCKNLDELDQVGTFFLQNHVKHTTEPLIVDYKKLLPRQQEETHGKTIEIKKENQFDQIIAKYPLVVVDFYATWCGPCLALAPSLADLSMDYPAVKIIKVDVDKFPNLAHRGQVKAMPTILYYFKQKEVKRQQGGSKGSIDANISTLLEKMTPKEKELALSLH